MDPIILHIETATRICSVALSKGKELITLKESDEKNAHSKNIGVFIDEIFTKHPLEIKNLKAIAVSMGPGSYTGLRIGVSTAKGLCYSLEKPLIAVNTLQSMASGMSKVKDMDAIYCPMIDARRMEVYAALFDRQNQMIRETKAELIDENSYQDFLKEHQMIFFGDGAEKCEDILSKNSNAIFDLDFQPSAKYMIDLALAKFQQNAFEDVAYFEPYYLKDFIAGKPKVKGLK